MNIIKNKKKIIKLIYNKKTNNKMKHKPKIKIIQLINHLEIFFQKLNLNMMLMKHVKT